MISHGETGFLAEVGDVTAMARDGLRILSDANLQRRLGQQAREKVLKHFTTDFVVPMYENLYDTMIEQ